MWTGPIRRAAGQSPADRDGQFSLSVNTDDLQASDERSPQRLIGDEAFDERFLLFTLEAVEIQFQDALVFCFEARLGPGHRIPVQPHQRTPRLDPSLMKPWSLESLDMIGIVKGRKGRGQSGARGSRRLGRGLLEPLLELPVIHQAGLLSNDGPILQHDEVWDPPNLKATGELCMLVGVDLQD